jgi:hypothetical protein
MSDNKPNETAQNTRLHVVLSASQRRLEPSVNAIDQKILWRMISVESMP